VKHHGNRRSFAEAPHWDHDGAGRSCGAGWMRGMRGEGHGGRRGFGRPGDGAGRGDGLGAGGRGRRRMFESGELRLVMLLLIEAEPRHGYDIIREIENRTGGGYAPSPGVVYPTLTLLEDVGQVHQVEAPAPDGGRKLYAITEPGKAHLAENRAAAEQALARLEALRRRGEALDAGPVMRAMANLKTALQQRVATAADKELLFAVADLIDEAARKIERL
jgi:DNA-binding PadR family transcriptional regulator